MSRINTEHPTLPEWYKALIVDALARARGIRGSMNFGYRYIGFKFGESVESCIVDGLDVLSAAHDLEVLTATRRWLTKYFKSYLLPIPTRYRKSFTLGYIEGCYRLAFGDLNCREDVQWRRRRK